MDAISCLCSLRHQVHFSVNLLLRWTVTLIISCLLHPYVQIEFTIVEMFRQDLPNLDS